MSIAFNTVVSPQSNTKFTTQLSKLTLESTSFLKPNYNFNTVARTHALPGTRAKALRDTPLAQSKAGYLSATHARHHFLFSNVEFLLDVFAFRLRFSQTRENALSLRIEQTAREGVGCTVFEESQPTHIVQFTTPDHNMWISRATAFKDYHEGGTFKAQLSAHLSR